MHILAPVPSKAHDAIWGNETEKHKRKSIVLLRSDAVKRLCGRVVDGLQVFFFFVFVFFSNHREKKAVPTYVMFVIILIVGKFDHTVGALEHKESEIRLNSHIQC